ncbi:hypothetical protein BKI52_18810 [marine bacterium AO1-C]|nr:hypothetical protein BKI52_18810 [marine bacterium AO1-C]
MKYLFFAVILLIARPSVAQIYIPSSVDIKGIHIGKTTKEEILKKYGRPTRDEKVRWFRRAKKKEQDEMKLRWIVEEVGHKLIYKRKGLEFTFYTREVTTNKAESLHSIIFTKRSKATTEHGVTVGVHTVKHLRTHMSGTKFTPMPLKLGLLKHEKGYNVMVWHDLRGTSEAYKDKQIIDHIEVTNLNVIKYK